MGPAKWRLMWTSEWLVVLAVTLALVTISASGIWSAIRAGTLLGQIIGAAIACFAAVFEFGFLCTLTPSVEIKGDELHLHTLTGTRVVRPESIKQITLRHRESKPGHATIRVRRIRGSQNSLVAFFPSDTARDFADRLSQATGAPVVETQSACRRLDPGCSKQCRRH